MKIGIFGGSFDPPTVAHEIIAKVVYAHTDLDKLIIVPSFAHLQKTNVVSFEDRYTMCSSAFDGWTVSDIDTNTNGTALDLVTQVAREYNLNKSTDSISYVIGGDCARNIMNWVDHATLLSRSNMITVTRRGVSDRGIWRTLKRKPHTLIKMDIPTSISSSKVRKLIREGKPYKRFLSPSVAEWIDRNNLYKGK